MFTSLVLWCSILISLSFVPSSSSSSSEEGGLSSCQQGAQTHEEKFECLKEMYQYETFAMNTDSYSCFDQNSEEIDIALEGLMVDSDSADSGWYEDVLTYLRSIGDGVDLIIEGSNHVGLITFILMREVFGFNVSLMEFGEEAVYIIEYGEPPHANLENFPSSFASFGDESSFTASIPAEDSIFLNGLQCNTYWSLQSQVHAAILNELQAANSSVTFLDFYKMFTFDEVIDELSTDPFIAETSEYIHTTWKPSICDTKTCGTLFVNYNDKNKTQLHDISIITDYNMRLRISYFVDDETHSFISSHLQNKTRVLWSISSPSLWSVSDEFVKINSDDTQYTHTESGYKLYATKLQFRSLFGYDLLSNILISNEDYDWINARMWDKNDGKYYYDHETALNEACQWLKNKTFVWLNWIPSDPSKYQYSCESYGDEALQSLVFSDNELVVSSEFIDQITAKRILSECLASGDTNPVILQAAQAIAIVAMVIQTFIIVLTIYFRDQTIIVSSSYKIVLIMLFGGYFALFYAFHARTTSFYVMLLRPIMTQTALVLMMTSLVGKTWRLQSIKTQALKGQTAAITDQDIVVRIVIFYTFALVIVGIMRFFCLFPAVVEQEVYDQEVFDVLQVHPAFVYIHALVLLCEIFCFMYVAFLAWKLRDINLKYNESRYIAAILYNTTLFTLLILILQLNQRVLRIQPYILFAIQALLWIIMVLVNTMVLIVPKLYHIYRGTHFIEAGLSAIRASVDQGKNNSYMISFDKRAPSKKDIRLMRSILRKIGYAVTKTDAVTSSNNLSKQTRTDGAAVHSTSRAESPDPYDDTGRGVHAQVASATITVMRPNTHDTVTDDENDEEVP